MKEISVAAADRNDKKLQTPNIHKVHTVPKVPNMSYRNEQVSKELRKALGIAFQEELQMERYGLITITDVVVTQGLEQAKVFVSSMRHGRDLVKKLNKNVSKWKKLIKNNVNLRKIPTMTFEYDISIERVEKMEQLMKKDTPNS